MHRTMILLTTLSMVFWIGTAKAADLGISPDDLLAKFESSAQVDGVEFDIDKLSCMENPKPGDDTKIIVSCSHSLGNNRVFITNSDPEGAVLDIATQMWPEESATSVVGWLANALNENTGNEHGDTAMKLVSEAKSAGTATAIVGKDNFFVLSMGPNFMISVSRP